MLICGFFVFGTESECTIGYVKCGNKVDCIYAGLICDGTQQCPDGSMKTRKSVHKVNIVLITGFLTRLTRRVPLVEQKLLILLEHMSSPPVFGGVCVTRSLILCVVFPFVLVLFAIVLSDLLRYTDYNYPFGIVKLF
jgi:hypothetical protein